MSKYLIALALFSCSADQVNWCVFHTLYGDVRVAPGQWLHAPTISCPQNYEYGYCKDENKHG